MMKQYEKEFKTMIVGLLESGQPARQVAEDYGLSASMIRRWRRESRGGKEAFTGKGVASLTPEQKKIQQLEKELRESRMEAEILKKANRHLLPKRRDKYRFIEMNRHRYPVGKMLGCLGVSKNGYYTWERRKDKKKTSRKEELKRKGILVSRSYVARLMKEEGLRSCVRKKYIATTGSGHGHPVAENTLKRNFKVEETGKVWVPDITYIRVNDGWCYLTSMLDLADRKVVGWSLSSDMTAENTVIAAWVNARKNRQIKDGFVLHSDRGVQYACNKTTSVFSFNRKMKQSMSRKGDCWDNAVAESFFKSIKYEWLNRFEFTSYDEVYRQVAWYINWYNTKRLHASLGYKTPKEKEAELNFIQSMAA
ncbi:IS3 family transposase [Flammeovirgaceae bacterium SG7u.111]|nr:IS3 family transposase [Flammeovirgaceae bacterium SG7u.132]WPO38778.1 IS3 family transposase [Flammeovirgaceae bacterium SG7u.111]